MVSLISDCQCFPLFLLDAVPKGRAIDARRQQPRDRIAQKQHEHRVIDRENRQNPEDSEEADAHQNDTGRENRMADAAHAASDHVHPAAHRIRNEHDVHPLKAPVNHGGVWIVDGKQPLAEQTQRPADA